MVTRLICGLCFILATFSISLAKEWRGIVPLHSTCEDAKRILGIDKCETGTYFLKDKTLASIFIWFSEYPCHPKWPSESYSVPPGRITAITVIPSLNHYPKISDLGIDESKFEKTEIYDQPGYFTYFNKEEGFCFYLTPSGEVTDLSYTPSSKDDYLRCPSSKSRSKDDDGNFPSTIVDKYGDLPFDKEKERLKEFASALQQNWPDAKGYIIVYAGRRARIGEAQERAERARAYLVNTLKIAADRIVTIDGGYNEVLTVDLYIRPRGAVAPFTFPSVHPTEVQIIDSKQRTQQLGKP
jgi:hypothetical protein